MSPLAFYATPIDFSKNEKVEQKLNDAKKSKLNLNLLKQMSQPKEEDMKEIHENAGKNIKEENEETLADFYSTEMDKDLKTKIAEEKHKKDLYQNENIKTDFLISNHINVDQVHDKQGTMPQQNDILLSKLNHIIQMFEEQKDIRTNQKNEEVVLYCFLGIFVIYVLDSFVYIGKYKRD